MLPTPGRGQISRPSSCPNAEIAMIETVAAPRNPSHSNRTYAPKVIEPNYSDQRQTIPKLADAHPAIETIRCHCYLEMKPSENQQVAPLVVVRKVNPIANNRTQSSIS